MLAVVITAHSRWCWPFSVNLNFLQKIRLALNLVETKICVTSNLFQAGVRFTNVDGYLEFHFKGYMAHGHLMTTRSFEKRCYSYSKVSNNRLAIFKFL